MAKFRVPGAVALLLVLAGNALGQGWTPIYAIRPDGDMLYYKHTGAGDGSASWPVQGVKIGNGWNFSDVMASGR